MLAPDSEWACPFLSTSFGVAEFRSEALRTYMKQTNFSTFQHEVNHKTRKWIPMPKMTDFHEDLRQVSELIADLVFLPGRIYAY